MDALQAIVKLIADTASLKNLQSQIDKQDYTAKVKVDTSQAQKSISDSARLSQANSEKTVKAFSKIQNEAIKTGNVGKTLGDKMKAAWEKLGGGSFANKSLMLAWQELKKGIQFVRELDDALTDVAYTSNVSKSQLKNLGNSTVDMAKDLSASAANVLEAVKIYSTAKTSVDDILRKSKPAILLSNVSGMSGAESSKTIQTSLNQFELEDTEETLMDIVDTLEYTSSQLNYDFTEGIKQITQGIEASGSVAKSAGLDMQEYAAMVGVAVEKTGQSGSTIGNAYKTIFSRITNASSIEGTLTEDISKAEEALRSVGVQVRDSNEDFRDMTDIMADIDNVWGGLTDTQKAKVGYEVAGITQLNVLNSLFGSWDEYSAIVENSEDRVGIALKNQEEHADSLGGRLEELGATGKSIWNNVLNTEVFKGSVSFLTDLLGIIDRITKSLGTLGTIGLGVGLFKGFKNIGRPKMFGLKLLMF